MTNQLVFSRFFKLFADTLKYFHGENGFKANFWWAYRALTDVEKAEIPPESLLNPEKVFDIFQKYGENVTAKIFFKELWTLHVLCVHSTQSNRNRWGLMAKKVGLQLKNNYNIDAKHLTSLSFLQDKITENIDLVVLSSNYLNMEVTTTPKAREVVEKITAYREIGCSVYAEEGTDGAIAESIGVITDDLVPKGDVDSLSLLENLLSGQYDTYTE
ncbi:hypothetical protein KC901_00525 [Patescibacteria group bacterium]|nr:hypothetical protein [Patescibacteria group bacterium]